MRLTAETDSARSWPAASAEAQPLFDDEFNGLMHALGPFEQRPSLGVAVSGGPDSLALAILAAGWAKARGGQVIGLTVDHGLRATSSDEARQTEQWLKAHQIEHHTLPWTGPKPSTGVQQRARNARYDLLHAWCRKAGVLHLLTAHHRGDQAETVSLRNARQSGPDGLAGMAAIRDLPGLRQLRPLLGVDKVRLIATLRRIGQSWIDDPSNQNLAFTRNRLRHQGIDVEGLADLAATHGRARHRSERTLSSALARFVIIDPAGFAMADETFLEALPPKVADTLVARVLMTIGGDVYPPRNRGLTHLAQAMRQNRPFAGKTLGHCRIQKQKQSWLFCREPAFPPASPLVPGQWQAFDNRFRLRLRSQQHGLFVRAIGEDGWTMRNSLKERGFKGIIPPAARSSLPSIWQDRTLLAIPHFGLFERGFDPSLLDLKFWPLTPLANAPFAAHMLVRE